MTINNSERRLGKVVMFFYFSDMPKKKISAYDAKRDFEKTPEPRSKATSKAAGDPVFVIQKHDATTLHYDFRLEIDGTLKSWAVPKGPSTNPKEKRMAIPVEAHPMEYGDFEGVIPQGNYGGGTVMLWDRGTYENLKEENGKKISLAQCYKDGRLEIWLHGEKIKGGYALVKMNGGPMRGNWLLIKMKDSEADATKNPVETELRSVKTGRTMEEIGSGKSSF